MSELQNRGRRPVGSFLILLLFSLLVFGFTGASLLAPKRTFSSNENRLLAQRPRFSSEALWSGKLTSEYETYITDQFFLRDDWIRMKTLSELALNKQDINGVYLAKDGYLIERHTDAEIDADTCAKNISNLVSFAERYIEQLGTGHVKVMLVPTASELLTDKLPAFANGFDQKGMLDGIYAQLPEGVGTDVRPALKEHAKEYIYYKTDHHWTTLGAFYAYQAWAEQSGFSPARLEDVTQVAVAEDFLGTIHSKLNLEWSKDIMYRFDLPTIPAVTVEYDMLKEKYDTMYMESHLATKDKYSYYLDGNHGLVEIRNQNPTGDGSTLLLIKDSFSHCFAPFTTQHFDTVYLVDFRYFNMPISQFIENYGVTDILVLYNGTTFATDIHTFQFLR